MSDQTNKKVIKPQYACTRCKKEHQRNELVAKRVHFATMGRSGKLLKSRTVAWLCPSCLEREQEWNLSENKGGVARPPEAMNGG